MLLLNVKYEEKEKVKSLGARWNPELKRWYVSNPLDYYKFIDWLEGNIVVSDYIYIIEGITTCWKCKKNTKVVAIGVDKYMELYDEPSDFESGEIHVASGFEGLPNSILRFLSERCNVKERYSKTIGSKYLSNGCFECDSLQGDWFLFNEPDSPFFVDSIDTAKALTLYKIKLENDIALPISISWGSEDRLIKEYATIKEFKDIKI